MDAGDCLRKIQNPVYTIWHSEQNPIDTLAILLSPDSVILSLPVEINGIPSGTYWAYKYYVTNTYEHSVSAPLQILDGWARYSSTNGYGEYVDAILPDPYMDNFTFSNDGSTAIVSLSTYAFFVAREFGSSPAIINRWIPTNHSLIDLSYSLHIS